MKSVCQRTATRDVFLANLFSIRQGSTVPIPELGSRDAAALDLAERTAMSLKYEGWDGNEYYGDCTFKVSLTLPKRHASEVDPTPLHISLAAKLTRQENGWVVEHVRDVDPSDQQARELRVYLSATVFARAREIEQVRRAERQARAEQELAAHAEWIKNHPAEHAEQQRRARLAFEFLAKAAAQTEAENRRRQAACQVAGGIWGRRTQNRVAVGPLGCFTR
jgi:hypothetical protein